MVNLSFSDKELEKLRDYFLEELARAQKQVDEIRGILDKIGGSPVSEVLPVTKSAAGGKSAEITKPSEQKQQQSPKAKDGFAELIEILDKSEEEEIPAARTRTKANPARSTAQKSVPAASKPVKIPKIQTRYLKSGHKRHTKIKIIAKHNWTAEEWADGVIAVVTDNPQLVAHQIIDEVIKRYDLSGDNLADAPEMVQLQLDELCRKGTLFAYGDKGSEPMYGLKLKGK